MNNPKISIVTVCYNSVDSLEMTLLSVIKQDYDNVEYIIIDGGSTDGSVDIIKKYSDKISYWVSEKDGGIYDAMNKGITVATGKYINFLNAGDTFYDNYVLSSVSRSIEKDTIVAYGQMMKVYNRFKFISDPEPVNLDGMKGSVRLPHPAMFVKSIYQKKHLFDQTLRSAADFKFYFNAHFVDGCKFQYLPMLIANYDCETGMSKDNYIGYIESLIVQGHEVSDHFVKYVKIKKKIISFLKNNLPEIIITIIRKRKFSKSGFNIIEI